MPNLKELQKTIEREKLTGDPSRAAFLALLAGMSAFQNGTGPMPSVEEFLAWRSEVETHRARQHFSKSRPAPL